MTSPLVISALSRTARFVNAELLGMGADEAVISNTLWGSTVRIIADRSSAASGQGQLLIATLVNLVVRMGPAVSLGFPDLALVKPLPLVEIGGLKGATTAMANEVMPEPRALSAIGVADVCVVLGAVDTRRDAIWVSVDDWSATVSSDPIRPGLSGRHPWGPMAGAALAAAAVLRRLLPKIAAVCGVDFTDVPASYATVDLRELLTEPIPSATEVQLPPLDFVSGGAITNASIYALRAAEARLEARVFDDDFTEESNLNRNVMTTIAHVGSLKVAALESQAREFLVTPVAYKIKTETRSQTGPLQDFVLVGADDVRARWDVQNLAPRFLAVGATQGQFVMVSTHTTSTSCVGCVHPVPNPLDQVVPTISFVSFWAGLLQAMVLMSHAAGHPLVRSALHCWPFGSSGPGILPFEPVRNPECPLECYSGAA